MGGDAPNSLGEASPLLHQQASETDAVSLLGLGFHVRSEALSVYLLSPSGVFGGVAH
jgi:hypothetical protein